MAYTVVLKQHGERKFANCTNNEFMKAKKTAIWTNLTADT